jgi:hypothetical protein
LILIRPERPGEKAPKRLLPLVSPGLHIAGRKYAQ